MRLLTGCVMPESKYHIRAPLKKADIPLPAHTAFAVLQADELLLHATPASGTDYVAFSHSIASHTNVFLMIGYYSRCLHPQ